MKIFFIQNNVEGLLSALFYSFVAKVVPDEVTDGEIYQQKIDDEITYIKTDAAQAERVQTALTRYGGYDIIRRLKNCMLSCDENATSTAFRYAYKTLFFKKDISGNLADPTVAQFVFTEQKVLTERHHIIGFLRFRESAGGVIYARFSPDNDITELVAPHFLKRLSGLPFVIHDIKRNKIAISDGFALKFDHTDLPAAFTPSDDEEAFANLWRRYYKEINIEERKNLKQQDRFMPRRYRKFMPETYERF